MQPTTGPRRPPMPNVSPDDLPRARRIQIEQALNIVLESRMALLRLCILIFLVAVVTASCGGGVPRGGQTAEDQVVPPRLPRTALASPAQRPAAQAASDQTSGESAELPTAPDTLPGAALTVTFRGGSFLPKRLEAPAGQTVTFVNESDAPMWPASNIHPTHEILPGFDAKSPIEPGESWTFLFEEVGFWRYHNHLSPSQSGIVVITGEPRTAKAEPLVIDPGELTFEDVGAASVQDVIDLFRNDTLLDAFVKRYGPAATVRILSENESRVGVDCHQRAHVMGRLAYEQFGAIAFSLSGHECHSGGYHGATEAFFHDRGTSNLQSDIGVVCGAGLNNFFRHQCVHGIGHGLMAWTSYELLDALELCDLLEAGSDQQSCFSGVFMENVVGGLSGSMGHFSEFLSDDPHFPCNILDDRYVVPCYFFQSSRMIQVFGGDFERLAAACAEAPSAAHAVCFGSMGRDVGGVTRGDPEGAIRLCSHAEDPANRLDCLDGAVQDSFWDPSGADDALAFCRTLGEDDAKRRCYSTIVERARFVLRTPEGIRQFCGRLEEGYRQGCG